MPVNLDPVEWNFIIAITDVLKPTKHVTEKMNDETYPTDSQYYPIYIALINILQPQPTATTLIRDMSNTKGREALKFNYLFFSYTRKTKEVILNKIRNFIFRNDSI